MPDPTLATPVRVEKRGDQFLIVDANGKRVSGSRAWTNKGSADSEASQINKAWENAKSERRSKGAPEITQEAKLSSARRAKLPKSSFAIPEKRAYPIHDENHARAALSMVAKHGSADEKKRVRAAVKRRYSHIGSTQEASWVEQQHPRGRAGKWIRKSAGALMQHDTIRFGDKHYDVLRTTGQGAAQGQVHVHVRGRAEPLKLGRHVQVETRARGKESPATGESPSPSEHYSAEMVRDVKANKVRSMDTRSLEYIRHHPDLTYQHREAIARELDRRASSGTIKTKKVKQEGEKGRTGVKTVYELHHEGEHVGFLTKHTYTEGYSPTNKPYNTHYRSTTSWGFQEKGSAGDPAYAHSFTTGTMSVADAAKRALEHRSRLAGSESLGKHHALAGQEAKGPTGGPHQRAYMRGYRSVAQGKKAPTSEYRLKRARTRLQSKLGASSGREQASVRQQLRMLDDRIAKKSAASQVERRVAFGKASSATGGVPGALSPEEARHGDVIELSPLHDGYLKTFGEMGIDHPSYFKTPKAAKEAGREMLKKHPEPIGFHVRKLVAATPSRGGGVRNLHTELRDHSGKRSAATGVLPDDLKPGDTFSDSTGMQFKVSNAARRRGKVRLGLVNDTAGPNRGQSVGRVSYRSGEDQGFQRVGKRSLPTGSEDAFQKMKATAGALGLPWDDAEMRKQMGLPDPATSFSPGVKPKLHEDIAPKASNGNTVSGLGVEKGKYTPPVGLVKKASVSSLSGKRVVVTGKLTTGTRTEIHAKIANAGGHPEDAITGKTHLLVVGDKPGSKLKKAMDRGIPVITEHELHHLVEALERRAVGRLDDAKGRLVEARERADGAAVARLSARVALLERRAAPYRDGEPVRDVALSGSVL